MLKSLQLPQEEEGEEAEALQLLSTIDLVVFKIPMINKPIVAWLESTFTALQEGGFFPAEIPTRFVAVKYEDDGLETTKLLHPHLNDLIFLPLDRLVFLQKMEILLGLPGKIKPSYLFMQEHKMNIELAKLARMEKLSDVGCAIRNPTPLTQGVSVRFKFRLPNEEAFTIALARSYSSVAHPEKEGEFLVYFYFFGIDKDSLKNIKRYCNQKPKFRPLLEEDSSRFDFVAQNLFLTEQEKKMKTVVVLDPNPTASENITGIIESDFDRVLIKAENSYYIFLKDYLRDPSLQASKSDTPSGSGDTFALVTNNDLYAPSVSWIVASDSGNLVVLQSKAKEGDKILGYDAQDMFSTDQDWKKLFEGKDNENLLAESLTILSLSDQNLKKRFALSSESGQSMWTDVDFTPLNQPKGQVLITITPMENPDWKKKDDSTLNSLDLLVIHEDFIPENLENWYDHIQNLALQNRLCTMTDPFKIIVISEATKRSKEVQQKFRHSKVAGLLFKPLDLRSFLLQISVLTQCPFTKHNSENQNYLDVHI
ncbi:MAG: hypothetical protein KDD35_10190, partial [Bdellovibrionales bacterium]|nr:hypothetical protein [Bdellovibrionales bacterium]